MAGPAPAATITVYGPDDQPVEVSATEAPALLRSGQFGLPENAAVPVQQPDGTWQTVTGAEAVRAAQSYQTRLGSAADVDRTAREESFRGLPKMALAGASGVVDSLALGFGDAGVIAGADALGYGQEAREFYQDANEFAPGSRMVGQGAGMLLPLAFTGGSSAGARGALGTLGRAVTAPARALTAGAEAIGAGARAIPVAGRILAPAATQAVELGVYGAGSSLSQAMIRDPQADGEALAGAMGQGFLHGASTGALFGGGFGVAGAGLRMAGNAGQRMLAPVIERGGQVLERGRTALSSIPERLGVALGEVPGRAEGMLASLPGRAEELAGRGLDRATELAQQVTGRAPPRLAEGATLAQRADRLARTAIDVDKQAMETTLRQTGAGQKLLDEARALPADVQKRLAQQVEAYGGGKVLSHAEQAQAAIATKRAAGEALGAKLDELESVAAIKPDVAAWARRARREVVAPLERIAGAEPVVSRLDSYLTSLESKAEGMGYREFHAQRAYLDDLIYTARRSGEKPLQKAFEQMRGVLEERFANSAQQAVRRSGGGNWLGEYKALKADYRAAAVGEKMTAEGAKRTTGNRTIGMSEQFGAVTGAILGGGGPLGLATAVGGMAVQRAVKTYGDQAAGAVLREMQRGVPLAQAVYTVTQKNVGEQVARFFQAARPVAERALERGREIGGRALVRGRELGESALTRGREVGARVATTARAAGRRVVEGAEAVGRTTVAVAGRAERTGLVIAEQRRQADEYRSRRQQVASVMGAGDGAVAATARRLVAAGSDPESAQVAAQVAVHGAQYLGSTMPSTPQRAASLQPELRHDLPSTAEMDEWLDRAAVVDDPDEALHSLLSNTLTGPKVEALREVYPQRYDMIRSAVAVQLQHLNAEGIELPYHQALQLGLLLDLPADPSLEPDAIALAQAAFVPPPPPPPSSVRPPNVARLYDLRTEISR